MDPKNANFISSVENFTKLLKEYIHENPSWMPDFICICGDIVDRGNVKLFEDNDDTENEINACSIIHEIMTASGINNTQRVLIVPGNHDLVTEGLPADYLEKTIDWLNNISRDGRLVKVPEVVKNVIKPFALFRKKFLGKDAAGEGSMNRLLKEDYLPQELDNISGCRIFKNEKILFLELNSAFCNLPNKAATVMFHRAYIDRLYNLVKRYKLKGFYVVALFHHSLRYLTTSQYAGIERINTYDQIVDMADLCLTGHDHGYYSKEPDKLANKCQHILNSGFFSINPKTQSFDSGATLIKIERYSECISLLRLHREADNKWTADHDCRIYSTATNFIDPAIAVARETNYKISPCISIRTDKTGERLYEYIRTRIFGNHSSEKLTTDPENKWSSYEIKKGVTSQSVILLHESRPYTSKLYPEVLDFIEQKSSTIVIICINLNGMKPFIQDIYKSELESYVLRGRVIIVPVLIIS